MLQLLKVNYHHQLLSIMLNSTFVGTLSVNILVPYFLAMLFYQYVEHLYIYIWLILNTIIFIARVLFIKVARKIEKAEDGDINSILYILYIIFIISALLHAYALYFISIDDTIPEMYLFFMAIITMSLVAGSSATLGSVLSAFVIYVVSNTLPIIFIFIYHGSDIYYMFSLAAFIFMFVYLKSGYMQYQLLSENIHLKESFEKRVQESADEVKTKEKLIQKQSRLVQMGEMLSMIAHQWRQPLSAISSTSTSINLKARLNKLDKEYIIKMTDNISDYAQHLSETIDDFRNFFKPNKEKDKTSFNEMLNSVLKIVGFSLEKHNIELITSLNCNENFYSYSSELKQVILNLIKNAEDVIVEQSTKNPYIKILTKKENNKFIMQVSDNAGGISEEIREKIFTPYFSTKKKKDGTGLGLYMSKTIVEEHCQGTLREFNDEFGAVFEITISSQRDEV